MKMSIASALVRRYAIELTKSYHGNVANPRHFLAAILWFSVFMDRNDIGRIVRCSPELSGDIDMELRKIPDLFQENLIDIDSINASLSQDLTEDYCLIEGRNSVSLSLSSKKMLDAAAHQAFSFGYDRIYIPHLFYGAVSQSGPKFIELIESVMQSSPALIDQIFDCMAAGGNTGVGSV